MIYTEAITILHIKHGASKEEIKKAFTKLAHIHHPDKGGEAKKFIEVKQAYDFLMVNDPPKNNGGSGFNRTGKVFNWNTGEWEEEPPTTRTTHTRSKASSYEGYSYQGRAQARIILEQEIENQKQVIERIKGMLRDQEDILRQMEFKLKINMF